ncbi:MAG: DUF4261 domain-containing protein [Chloracidobacterium sp.]|nr:DUF4261 domain-containing protein [Chloracidobacterium sp.]
MENEIIVCIPGTWESRTKLIESVIVSTSGDFMFAGMILAHPKGNDHAELEFYDADEQIAEGFAYGGQGKLSDATLDQISQHQSVVYLHFPFGILEQKARLLKFTEVLSKCGGIAVKLETSGVAHEWKRWFELLNSDNLFGTYCATVVLVVDEDFYYSCGMHNFGLADVQISNSFDAPEAADLLNKFSFWQLVDKPILKAGHTFSLTADSPHFRLELSKDKRHSEGDLFYNPNGLWELQRV